MNCPPHSLWVAGLALWPACALLGGDPATATLAAVVLAPTCEALAEGPAEAALVFVEPRRSPPKPRPEPPKPEATKPPPRTEPPKPTGPSPELIAAERELASIRGDTSAVAQADAQVRDAEAELRTAGGALRDELTATERKMQELTVGYALESQQVRDNKCCSVCGNSKMEIERKGERFEVHLTNVKGTVAQCKGDKLAAVQRKWETQIAPVRSRLEDLRARMGPARDAAQRKIDAAKAAAAEARRKHEAAVQAAEARAERLRR